MKKPAHGAARAVAAALAGANRISEPIKKEAMTKTPWEVVRTDAGFHVRFVAANGEPVLSSEVYPRKETAEEAIDLVCDAVIAVHQASEGRHAVQNFYIDERTSAH